MKHNGKNTKKNFMFRKQNQNCTHPVQFKFFMIEGKGNPNDAFLAEYIGVLYSLSYAVKMSPKKGLGPENYEEYTVYPWKAFGTLPRKRKKISMEKSIRTLLFSIS